MSEQWRYNGDTVHDMWVDYGNGMYQDHSGNSSYYYPPSRCVIVPLLPQNMDEKTIQSWLDAEARTVRNSEMRLGCIKEAIRRAKESLAARERRLERMVKQQKRERYQPKIDEARQRLAELERMLVEEEENCRSLKARRTKRNRILTCVFVAFAVVVIAGVLFLLQ